MSEFQTLRNEAVGNSASAATLGQPPNNSYHRQLALYTASLAVQRTLPPTEGFNSPPDENHWAIAGPSGPSHNPAVSSSTSSDADHLGTPIYVDPSSGGIQAGLEYSSYQTIPFIPYPSMGYGYHQAAPSASSFSQSSIYNPHFGYTVRDSFSGKTEDAPQADHQYARPDYRSSYPLAHPQYPSSVPSETYADNRGLASSTGSTSSEMDSAYLPSAPYRSYQSYDSASFRTYPLAPAAPVSRSESGPSAFALPISSLTNDQQFGPLIISAPLLDNHDLVTSPASIPSSQRDSPSSGSTPYTAPSDIADPKSRRFSDSPARLPISPPFVPAQKGRRRKTVANAGEAGAEWAGVEDGRERRRVQNRLAQRAFRARNRKRDEDIAESDAQQQR